MPHYKEAGKCMCPTSRGAFPVIVAPAGRTGVAIACLGGGRPDQHRHGVFSSYSSSFARSGPTSSVHKHTNDTALGS